MSYNDQYRPGGFFNLPVVTKNIIIICVLLYVTNLVLIHTQGINLDDYLGLHYYLAPSFKPHQFVTYIFMHDHVNPAHIFLNMFGVYMFGQVLEYTWGPKKYITFFILTGLGAALVQYLIMHLQISPYVHSMDQKIAAAKDAAEKINLTEIKNLQLATLDSYVVVGASGSLMGLLGAFGLLFPNQMLYLFMLVPVRAKWAVIGYGLLELYLGVSNNPGDNVAHFAHIGGLIVGVILVLIWKRKPYS